MKHGVYPPWTPLLTNLWLI